MGQLYSNFLIKKSLNSIKSRDYWDKFGVPNSSEDIQKPDSFLTIIGTFVNKLHAQQLSEYMND